MGVARAAANSGARDGADAAPDRRRPTAACPDTPSRYSEPWLGEAQLVLRQAQDEALVPSLSMLSLSKSEGRGHDTIVKETPCYSDCGMPSSTSTRKLPSRISCL
ncbi:MAG: hypothetical protein V3S95_00365, partial [Alphaproteobacteria bacterium]